MAEQQWKMDERLIAVTNTSSDSGLRNFRNLIIRNCYFTETFRQNLCHFLGVWYTIYNLCSRSRGIATALSQALQYVLAQLDLCQACTNVIIKMVNASVPHYLSSVNITFLIFSHIEGVRKRNGYFQSNKEAEDITVNVERQRGKGRIVRLATEFDRM